MVTYSSRYLYIRANGQFGETSPFSEQWTVGWKVILDSATDLTENAKESILTEIKADVQAFHQLSQLGSGSTSKLLELTAAYVGTDGKYIGGGSQPTTRTLYTPVASGVGVPVAPWSTAIVLGHRTENVRGKAARGRVYWPRTAASVDLDAGNWTIASQSAVLAAYKVLIDDINAACTGNLAAAVGVGVLGPESVLQDGTPRPAQHAVVTAVEVGRAPDTQRRRDKSIPEEYIQVNLDSATALIERLRSRSYV